MFTVDEYTGENNCWHLSLDDTHWQREYVGDIPTEYGTVKEEYQNIFRDVDDLVICLSGGLDSEIVALSCLEMGKEFTVAILRMWCDGVVWNEHDFRHAVDFCKAHSIVYKFYDLDCREFYDGGKFMEYAEKYMCRSPQLAAHLWLLEQIDGTVTMGDDFPYIRPSNIVDGKVSRKSQFGFASFSAETYEFFLSKNNKAGIPKPSAHNMKIMYAYLKLQEDMVGYYFGNEYNRKVIVYKLAGFDFEPRKSNYTGFEYLKMHYSLMGKEKNTFRLFNTLFRTPMEEMVGYPETSRIVLPPEIRSKVIGLCDEYDSYAVRQEFVSWEDTLGRIKNSTKG